jgi:hypothetical protein
MSMDGPESFEYVRRLVSSTPKVATLPMMRRNEGFHGDEVFLSEGSLAFSSFCGVDMKNDPS